MIHKNGSWNYLVVFLRYVIYEKASQLGGTWWENKYPGVACDIPSHFYSFSFFQNPYWTREYSTGKEIHEYLVEVNIFMQFLANSIQACCNDAHLCIFRPPRNLECTLTYNSIKKLSLLYGIQIQVDGTYS